MAEAAAEEVGRLESAVAALGEGNPLAKPLLAAQKVARSKVNVPVSEQIEMPEKYLARSRKRLVVANEELEKVGNRITVALRMWKRLGCDWHDYELQCQRRCIRSL